MSTQVQKEIWDELSVRHHWFHILRSAIIDNKIAEMGFSAWAVYCVVKAYTDLETGASYPSQSTIAGHLDTSVDTVQRALKKLIEMKLIEQEVRGRRSVYRLVEHVPLDRIKVDERGAKTRTTVAHATQTYAPLGFQGFISQLQDFAKNGKIPDGASFNVTVKLNVTNIHQGDHSTVHISNVIPDDSIEVTPAFDAAQSRFMNRIRVLRTDL